MNKIVEFSYGTLQGIDVEIFDEKINMFLFGDELEPNFFDCD